MQVNDLPSQDESEARAAWRARLAMRYARTDERSVLVHREHEGPLAVQKSLYPEGGGICHNFILHPPAGMAGGDEVAIAVDVAPKAHAVLSTPGAGKWYRSAGRNAEQRLSFGLEREAKLEWLPAETIVYSGALASLHTRVDVGRGAAYLGWEIVCMGRPASGESFLAGSLRQRTEIFSEGRLLWHENGALNGEDPLLASKVGMRGYTVNATLLAIGGSAASPEVVRELRALQCSNGYAASSLLGQLIVLRYLGESAQAARDYFAAARTVLRPKIFDVAAQPLRIWQT